MSEYDDSHMLSKILERMAAQSLHLKDKIDSGLEIPSWAEYKLYNAYSGLGKALGTAYPGTYGEEKMAAFSGALDRHPALKGKQSQLPDKIQAGIIKKKLRMRKQAAVTGRIHSGLGREDLLAEQARVRRQLAGEAPMSEGLTPRNAAILMGLTSGLTGLTAGGPGVAAASAPLGAAAGYYGIRKGLRDRDAAIEQILSKQAASTESQLMQALSAEGGAAGMKALRKRVKEDDLEQALKALIASGKVRRHPDGDLIKESASPRFSSDGDRLYHDLGGGVSFSLPEGAGAERYKKQVERDHGYVGSTAPTSKDDRPSVRVGKAISRRLDKKNPNRPRYRSLKDFVLRRPDPNYRPGAEVRSLKKQAAATATKTDPAKWEAAKREAKSKMGGKHSARAMQLATQIYKKKGGGYSGAKPTSQNNSLKKWTKQKWQWSGGDKPGQGGKGVYLPKAKKDRLKDSEHGRRLLARASKKKSEATRKGEQYSSHGLAANTSLKAKR